MKAKACQFEPYSYLCFLKEKNEEELDNPAFSMLINYCFLQIDLGRLSLEIARHFSIKVDSKNSTSFELILK